MIHSLSMFWCASLAGMLMLAGCGGGGTSVTTDMPNPSSQSVTCSLTWAWSNPVGQSGNALTPSAEVTWDNQSCSIQTATEASMTVCIQHPAPAELSLQLTRPDQIPLTLPALSTAQTTGICPNGSPWTFLLNAASLPRSQYTGPWTLRVTDQSPGNNQSGYLIGWSFSLKGNS